MDKIDIKSLKFEELKIEIENIGEKGFRAKQVFDWLHKKGVISFDEMINLPKILQQKLSEKFIILNLQIVEKLVSKDKTVKYLFKLQDNNVIESVFMEYNYANALCITSQVGCKRGCTFCASTLDGLERNLTAGEMLSQVYEVQKDTGKRIGSLVIMGSGEPFDNYDNFLKFIYIINDEKGINLGQRHITVSTCGIVPNIYKLADEKLQINLALSLHAPNDVLRKTMMPVANKYSIRETVDALVYFAQTTKRRVTYEYALIEGVNDRIEDAEELAKLIRGTLCHVNLIPINEVKERAYIKSSKEQIKKFADILTNANIETTIRRKLGSDINASCGQLRRRYKY